MSYTYLCIRKLTYTHTDTGTQAHTQAHTGTHTHTHTHTHSQSSSRECCQAGDGSKWRQAQWEGLEVTVREHNPSSKWTTTEMAVQEMEALSVLRHPNILLLMATCCGPSKHDLLLVTEPVKTLSLYQLLHHFENYLTLFHSQRISIACGITQGLKCFNVAVHLVSECFLQPCAIFTMLSVWHTHSSPHTQSTSHKTSNQRQEKNKLQSITH